MENTSSCVTILPKKSNCILSSLGNTRSCVTSCENTRGYVTSWEITRSNVTRLKTLENELNKTKKLLEQEREINNINTQDIATLVVQNIILKIDEDKEKDNFEGMFETIVYIIKIRTQLKI